MTTRADLRNAVIALRGQIPETMKFSLGSINHVLGCAQFAKEEVGDQLAGSVPGDDTVVVTLLSNVVALESYLEQAAGRKGVPDEMRYAMFSEFIVPRER